MKTAHEQDLTGVTARTVLGGSHLVGLALAFGLMVAARRYSPPPAPDTAARDKRRPKP
ncbi:hypothetical protein [Streptomyces sp. NPDC051218]|uniref:hypothetical protein n=1 Tax=Streptomyces sp. NPDC051218 TaxID=3365645 RepID=UPI0037AF5524